jgi:hypothetical protein
MSNEKYQLRELERAEARTFKISQERIENMQTKSNIKYKKPEEEGNTVYSNFNHDYEMTEEQVKNSGMYHQHAAWNFCGYAWFDIENQEFVEEVMIYRSVVNVLCGETLDEVIQEAIDLYGGS